MAARVPGFPHLRATRFLASYAGEILVGAQSAEWVRRLAELGRGGYDVEIANRPAAARARIEAERAQRFTGNQLDIPDPRGADREALFRAFAPESMVDVVSDAHRPGVPGRHAEAVPTLDGMRPVVYRRVSHTRYHRRALLQLSYAIWFPERPLPGE